MAEESKAIQVRVGARGVAPQDIDQLFRVANAVAQSGLAPRALNTPQKILVAMGHGMALGFDPFTAMTVVHVIEGSPSMSARGIRALILSSGATGGTPIQHVYSGTPYEDDYTCTVSTKRNGVLVTGRFSVADAKRAKLWGKVGPTGKPSGWVTYPDRMLLARAVGNLGTDHFSDVILGLRVLEEVEDDGRATGGDDREARVAALLPASDPLLELTDDGRTTDEPESSSWTDGDLWETLPEKAPESPAVASEPDSDPEPLEPDEDEHARAEWLSVIQDRLDDQMRPMEQASWLAEQAPAGLDSCTTEQLEHLAGLLEG